MRRVLGVMGLLILGSILAIHSWAQKIGPEKKLTSATLNQKPAKRVTKMKIASTSFIAGQPIPDRFSGYGENCSPDLTWSGVPPETKSLALVCDDLDAPGGTFVHWLVVNLPPSTQGITAGGPIPSNASELLNDSGQKTYLGPCPPKGKVHRYFFRLYALSVPQAENLNRRNYENEFKKYTLAYAEIMGTYQKK